MDLQNIKSREALNSFFRRSIHPSQESRARTVNTGSKRLNRPARFIKRAEAPFKQTGKLLGLTRWPVLPHAGSPGSAAWSHDPRRDGGRADSADGAPSYSTPPSQRRSVQKISPWPYIPPAHLGPQSRSDRDISWRYPPLGSFENASSGYRVDSIWNRLRGNQREVKLM